MLVESGWAPFFAICICDIDWLSRSLGENLRNVKINVIYLSVEVVAKNQIYFRLSVRRSSYCFDNTIDNKKLLI